LQLIDRPIWKRTLQHQAMPFILPATRRQPSGFVISFLLHGGLAYFFIFSPIAKAVHDRMQMARRYPVLVLRPQDFVAVRARAAAGNDASGPLHAQPGPRAHNAGTNEGQEAANAEPAPAPHPERPFALPPVAQHGPAKQTLVELDVPPEIQLKQNIPLPAALLWEHLPPVRREFIAPVAKPRPTPMVEMPSPPDLSAPNWERNVAQLKLSRSITTPNPKLVQPPAKTAPLASASNEPMLEPPQISTSDPGGTSVVAVISLPEIPLRSDQKVLVPPANQVASTGSGGTASSGSAHHSGNGPASASGESGGRGVAKTSSGGASSQSSGASGSQGTIADNRETGTGVSRPSGGSGLSSGSGNSSAGGSGPAAGIMIVSSNDQLPPTLPGTIRYVLPKDGKFPVVISGSSPAGPYAESAGALSGKMVYSVYVSVGLRKKWILQYCLSKSEEQKNPVRGRAQSVEAPWPYVVVRPESMTFSEYVIVHGILGSDGRFDHLALVSPADLEKKDLLISSLKQWTFRAANRDGLPSEVEILLIIPGQAE